MKSIIISMVAAAGLMVAGSALAGEPPASFKAKCGACHAVDKKLVGPSLNDISAKYKGNKDGVATMIANITKGGAFGYKLGTMPPKGMGANDAEIKEAAEYIAGLAH